MSPASGVPLPNLGEGLGRGPAGTLFFCGSLKAIVFRSALGMGLAEAPELRSALRDVLKNQSALATDRNAYGQKYQIDFKMARMNRSAVVRSVWIVRHEEAFPRLVTCYVL